MKLRLTFDLTLREDITAAEWTLVLGAALEHLRTALASGTVPVVTTTRAIERAEARRHLDESYIRGLNRLSAISAIVSGTPEWDAIVEALTGEPVLTTDEQAEAARHARDVVGRDAESPLCRCGHRRLMHDPVGATHLRGECNERGCRCGLFQSVEKVANANASAGGTR